MVPTQCVASIALVVRDNLRDKGNGSGSMPAKRSMQCTSTSQKKLRELKSIDMPAQIGIIAHE